jgi:cation transporter-like permease
VQQQDKPTHFGMAGIALGGIALILALVHFWAGPFAPQPTIETTVAEKAASIRAAAVSALKGEEPVRETFIRKWDADTWADVATAVVGGFAMILGVLAFAKHEPVRVAGGAAALGVSAIAFQFIAMYAMALLVVLLIAAALSSLGIDPDF